MNKAYYAKWYKGPGRAYNYGNKKLAISIQNDGQCCCCYCGETDLATLTFDHINNDGCKVRRQGEVSGRNLAMQIVKRQAKRPDIQILCMNCQFRKREYGSDFGRWCEERQRMNREADEWIKRKHNRDARRLSEEEEDRIRKLLSRIGHKYGAQAAIAKKFEIPPYAVSEFFNTRTKAHRKRRHFYRKEV